MESRSGSKSEGVTPNLSPNPSRRPSILAASGDDSGPVTGPGYTVARTLPREEQLRQQRQKAAARVAFEAPTLNDWTQVRKLNMVLYSGLRSSLADLSTFSNTTTRRLDDTYYSVLEKLGMLQSMVIALKELASTSQETNANFKKETEELVSEVCSQLDSFGQFEDQEERIESLKSRVHAGREKIEALSNRVDSVRERIEGWERADREWQERTRRRLKAIWVVTSAIAFVLVLILISAQYVPTSIEEATVRVANESLNYIRHASPGNGTQHGTRTPGGDGRDLLGSPSKGATGDHLLPPDDRLRIFDEL